MRSLVPNNGNDDVTTPDWLASTVVGHFRPQIADSHTVLEPCAGGGAFVRAFAEHGITNIQTCEIKEGRDFFAFSSTVDWIITNPPWSKAPEFFRHAYTLLVTNLVWLITLSHLISLRARMRDMRQAGYGLKEILLLDTPGKETGWPQSGFQLGAIHVRKGWTGDMRFSEEKP